MADKLIYSDVEILGELKAEKLTINGQFTFPLTDGVAGQLISTDGAGNLSFVNISAIALTASSILDGTGLTWTYNPIAGTLQGNVSLSPFSTSNLSEGTNLYFTNERVDDRVASLLNTGLTGTGANSVTWQYDDAANTLRPIISLAPFNTDALTEGVSNFYYTDERVDDRVSSLLRTGLKGSGPNSLIWTYNDALGRLTPTISLTPFNTDDLGEGSTNLYFTNERVDDRVSNLIQDSSTITWTYDDLTNTLTADTVFKIEVDDDGNPVGSQGILNFVPSSEITWTFNNDTLNGRIDISASASGGSAVVIAGSFTGSTIRKDLGNTVSSYGATVSGGYGNTASNYYATVSGGYCNTASGYYSIVSGGCNNTASGNYSFVGGGRLNVSSGDHSVTNGGRGNSTLNSCSTIGGGRDNTINGTYSTISGGRDNSSDSSGSTIGGGCSNYIPSFYGTIGGGRNNCASGQDATISGGYNNITDGTGTVIAGGRGNCAVCARATVGGGRNNCALNFTTTISGGYGNLATGLNTTISGGYCNTASGYASVVSGGRLNCTLGIRSTISGGYCNSASGYYSTIIGGCMNTSVGSYSTVVGGRGNVSSGDISTASGYYAHSTRYGERAHASGSFNFPGDAQHISALARAEILPSSSAILLLNQVGYRFDVQPNSIFSGTVNIVGLSDDGLTSVRFLRQVTIQNLAGTTSLVGSVITLGTDEDASAAVSVAITANDSNDSLKIEVTVGAISGTYLRVLAHVDGVEIKLTS